MTDAERQNFDKQAVMWRKRADGMRAVVSHVVWRNGRMEATITPRPAPAEPQWVPRTRRGVSQGRLL